MSKYNDISLSYIYQFFSNRNLLQWPKSNELIISDIYNELSLSYDAVISILSKYNDKYNNANKEYKNSITDSMMDNFYNHIDNTLKNNIDSYSKLSNLNKYKAYKNIYRLTIPNYIFTFIEMHKNIFPNILLEKIFPIIINTSYSKLSLYIKKTLILKLLLSNSKNKFSILSYYNYNRFLYMYTLLTSYNLEPIIYNPNSGSIYFTITYSKSQKKEQIFESMYFINNKNIAPIILDEVKLYINTQVGEISQVKKLFDKKNKKNKSKYIIIDNIDHKTPNVIRRIIHELISKYSNKSYKYSYNYLLGNILKENIIVEDYCEKDTLDGSILNVPLKGSFTELESKEVRKLNIKHLDISLLLNTYSDILNPILKIISSFKI